MALTMKEAKALGLKAAGEEFICDRGECYGNAPTGCIGRILPDLSSHKKLQAVLTCAHVAEDGTKCTNTHIREVSDWHQSRFCAEHAKTKKKSKGAGAGLGAGRSVKVEIVDEETSEVKTEIIREMRILETDDQEMRELKEQNNQIFAAALKAQEEREEKEKEIRKAEREAKLAEDRAKREEEAAAKKKAQAKEALERAAAYAAKMGLPVSQKTIAEAE